ncbi:bifunctional adenosylcobinamide kinase/adenosylcobinamide-phosphate guanylyltransferase [Aureimonas altamirensis]|uniref:bifunctional adenosylcobinamide kinase/adenosylcobinamide-phosphate guanylyltransferase n=1 Tax=Aureimonas altamirensis TaxID=370622 RepID=UPI001E3E3F3B|nr:bifunctional adenosylcobinamide kinase/adenosylcobinamide-phosphate guanylyltransferase [Aureimonas altamirensis]UHD45593.1 bifunctional adenosylcobinamide kinase/adenosylcobinamide-phosphate guanylyltransferase [Aureimonas altamirensis]
MRRSVFVLGGARSGKSAFAERLAAATGLERVYIATGQAFDAEMAARIDAHRRSRGDGWRTVEAPHDLAQAICAEARSDRVLVVDCLTLWLSNVLLADGDIAAAIDNLCSMLASADGTVIFVSNEVGLSIVPENALARAFRDHSGRMNQSIAALADEAWFVAAGLPLKLKG